MKKLLGLSALLLVASLPAMAQVSTPRIEVGGGYTFRSFAFPPAFNDAGGVVNFPRVNMKQKRTAGQNQGNGKETRQPAP